MSLQATSAKTTPGLTEAHGGTVEVRSDGIGKGSSFVVRLPIALGVPVDEKEPLAEETAHGPKRRILVVDDNRDGASSLAMLPTLMGHDTGTAHDRIEGIEAFCPDLIVLDVGLPKGIGLEAYRGIREKAWARDVCDRDRVGPGR